MTTIKKAVILALMVPYGLLYLFFYLSMQYFDAMCGLMDRFAEAMDAWFGGSELLWFSDEDPLER